MNKPTGILGKNFDDVDNKTFTEAFIRLWEDKERIQERLRVFEGNIFIRPEININIIYVKSAKLISSKKVLLPKESFYRKLKRIWNEVRIEDKFYYKWSVLVTNPKGLKPGMIVICKELNYWQITDVVGAKIELTNSKPMLNSNIGNQLTIVSNCM